MMRFLLPAALALGLLSGCVNQPGTSGPITTETFCQSQGSAQGVQQCRLYYAKYPNVQPPQPLAARSERSGYADRCEAYGYQPGTELFLNCIGQQQQIAIQAFGIWQASQARPQTIYVAPCTFYSQIARVC